MREETYQKAIAEVVNAHLSPLEWELITLTGVYRWNLDEKHDESGRMRPLQKLSPTPA